MIVKKDPKSTLSYLYSIHNIAKKKNRKQASSAVSALRDLFLETLIPDTQRLVSYTNNSLIKGKDVKTIKEKDLI